MQGYITLATGDRFYIELAINLALSIKLNDPKRPICLIMDEGATLPEEYTPYIDEIAYLKSKPGFHGCLNKLRVNEVSPYEESLFIDSDCILLKNDMDRHWSKFQAPGFKIAGGKVTKGNWYGFDIQDVIKTLGINYIVQMNSGVFYFRKSQETEHFFETALRLVNDHKDLLGTYHRNKLQLADEPFIGAAQGLLWITPLSYTPEEGAIMITTIQSEDIKFDPFTQTSIMTRKTDFRLLGRFLPRKRVAHSPSIAHFVKLKPKSIYLRISDQLRGQYGLQRFNK